MSWKNLFKRKKPIENELLKIPEEMDKTEVLNVPKVIFASIELQVFVGLWLRILNSCSTNLSEEKLKEIEIKFGFILKLAGIEETETCTLNNFNIVKNSVSCHFHNKKEDAIITFDEEGIESDPILMIDYPNENRTYEYYPKYENKPMRLELQNYTIKSSENGNICCRRFFQSSIYFKLQNGEYFLSLDISKPKNIKNPNGECFKLNNEEEWKQYLLGLSFPLDITEVYEKIGEIFMNSMGKYLDFELQVVRDRVGKKNEILDKITLSNGQLTITNWTYSCSKLTVNQRSNAISGENLSDVNSPFEECDEIREEVEHVKKLEKVITIPKEN